MTKKKFDRLHQKRLAARTAAYEFQAQHPETLLYAKRNEADRKLCRRADKLWAAYYKLDKRLYRYEQKVWMKQWRREDFGPYGAFANMPRALILLVERSYDYWMHGYNVHIVDENNHIHDTVKHAYELAQQVRELENRVNHRDGVHIYNQYRFKLIEFFTYVSENCLDWGD